MSRGLSQRGWAASGDLPLVGREAELSALRDQMLDHSTRLLTITGFCGVGKTRLAVALADEIGERFGHGVLHVDIAGVADPSRIVKLIADALDVPSGDRSSSLPRLHSVLADRDLLLIVDGCERAADHAGAIVVSLLTACPGVRVLVTSQMPLRVSAERLFPLPPLQTPGKVADDDPASIECVPSVALFTQRARAVSPGFGLTPDNAAAVAEICRRLDGLPLAVSLAAGRVRLFQPRALLARMCNGLDVLTGGPADAPPRHQSMRAAVRWAWGLLNETERAVAERLAVCEGGFGLPTVEALSAMPPDLAERLLESLVDKGLGVVHELPCGEPRFRMLQTVRAVALQELDRAGETDLARRCHAEHVLAFVGEHSAALAGPEQVSRLTLLGFESDNVRTALRFFLDHGETPKAAFLAAAFRGFWLVRGPLREGLRWLDASMPADATGTESAAVMAEVLDAAGTLALALGDLGGAVARHKRALRLCRQEGDERREGMSLVRLGHTLSLSGDRSLGDALLSEGLAILRALGTPRDLAAAWAARAHLAHEDGELERADRLLRAALATFRDLGDVRGLASALCDLGRVAAARGESVDAGRMWWESLRHMRDLGELTGLPMLLESLGVEMWRARRQDARAVRLLAVAARVRNDAEARVPAVCGDLVGIALAGLRARLGQRAFTATWREAHMLGVWPAVHDALSALSPRCGPTLVASASSIAPLTARQFQVATLVAQGLTNRQIARHLGIAEWTAVNHVRQVMRKLGCASRGQVARWVTSR